MPRPASKTIIKKCLICQNDFETKDTKRGRKKQTCGGSCSRKLGSKNSREITKCKSCNKETLALKAHITQDSVYCEECSEGKKYKRVCTVCGKDFRAYNNTVRSCSKECSAVIAGEKQTECSCTECGKKIKRTSRDVYSGKNIFCDRRCANRYHSRKNPSRYGGTWSRRTREIKERDKFTCQMCGRSKNYDNNTKLEVHHIIPATKFEDPNEAHYDENVVTYCRECHYIAESKINNTLY